MTDEPTSEPEAPTEVPGLIPEEPRSGPESDAPGEDTLPEEPGPAAPPEPEAPAPGGGAFDVGVLPRALWRIVKDPEGGLAASHMAGQAGALLGLCIGGIAILFLGIANKIHGGEGFPLMRAMGGGVGFIAGAGLASLLLRATLGKVGKLSWTDDFYLVGSALAYPLAAGGLGLLIGFVPGLETIGGCVGLVGCLLGAYAFREGFEEVGGVDRRRAIWLASVALSAGAAIGAAVGFVPFVAP